jgi:hypothetical protein
MLCTLMIRRPECLQGNCVGDTKSRVTAKPSRLGYHTVYPRTRRACKVFQVFSSHMSEPLIPNVATMPMLSLLIQCGVRDGYVMLERGTMQSRGTCHLVAHSLSDSKHARPLQPLPSLLTIPALGVNTNPTLTTSSAHRNYTH